MKKRDFSKSWRCESSYFAANFQQLVNRTRSVCHHPVQKSVTLRVEDTNLSKIS